MFDYSNQRYLIISMILMVMFYTTIITNLSYNSNYYLKKHTNISIKSILLIDLGKTPDEIARGPQMDIINSIEQNKVNKK